jgi:hypothetical protein
MSWLDPLWLPWIRFCLALDTIFRGSHGHDLPWFPWIRFSVVPMDTIRRVCNGFLCGKIYNPNIHLFHTFEQLARV